MSSTDLLSVSQARRAIKLSDTDASADGELQSLYIPAATQVVEDVVGPVLHREVSHEIVTTSARVPLSLYPVVTVTEVRVDGLAISPDACAVNRFSGVLRLSTAPLRSLTVTYTAGRFATLDQVPARFVLAARLVLAQNWRADHQGTRPSATAADSGATTPSGFLIPHRALALLSGQQHVDGFA